MNRTLKLLSTTALSASLLITAAAVEAPKAHADTVQVTKVPENKTGVKLDKTKPYYSYNGYFKPNTKLLLDKTFIAGVNNDNILINGYGVNKNKKAYKTSAAFYSKDVMINKYNKNTIVSMTIETAPKTINETQFKKAYKSMKLISTTATRNGSKTINYQTLAGTTVSAYFENGYLKFYTIY